MFSDAEYTYMLRTMQALYPNDEYVQRSWSSDPCPMSLLKRIGREDLIVDVILGDKTESIPSLNTELEVQANLSNFYGTGTMSMKHDGWHIQVNYYNGELVNIRTRGRTYDAVDAGSLVTQVPKTIPVLGKVRVSCEATVSKSNFLFCASRFGNANERSAVSTILANPEYIHLISLHAFDIFGIDLDNRCKFDVLKEWGFEVPKYYIVSDYGEILNALRELSDACEGYDYPTDGAVFDGHIRRAIRLLAWEEPIFYSYVTGYFEQYSLYRISPSILIYPFLRSGTTQRRINITNWQRIINHDLRPGSPIAFRIASSAIADFDEDATRAVRKEWEGRWEDYQKKIIQEEEVKRCNWQMLLSSQV
jgi:hypothetical protein